MPILKFRYWDPFNGVMVYSEDAKNLRSFFAGYEQAVRGGNEPIMMQCTGLRDKNGGEIYEGDVVYIIPYPRPVKVIFEKGTFGVRTKYGFWPLCDPEKNIDSIEIIGNMYDNPEFLESEEI